MFDSGKLTAQKTMVLTASVKEILLEIAFSEEMRASWGNKVVPQTFFHNSFYSRKYDLIRLTPFHWKSRTS